MQRGQTWALCAALALPSCTAGVPSIDARQMEIVGGKKETGYPSVFSLAYDGHGGCTGTCVTPHVGLTAKHCVYGEDPAILSGLFGETESEPTLALDVVAAAVAEDDRDIAVVAFADACPATTPFHHGALEPHVGEGVVLVGYGVTSEYGDDFGLKRSGLATLYSVDPEDVNGLEAGELATSNDPSGTCYGDSGGPTFMTFDGVEEVVGVTSRGSLDAFGVEEPCEEGVSIAVRTDSNADFLDAFVAAHEPEEEVVVPLELQGTLARAEAREVDVPAPRGSGRVIGGGGCAVAGPGGSPIAGGVLGLGLAMAITRRRARAFRASCRRTRPEP